LYGKPQEALFVIFQVEFSFNNFSYVFARFVIKHMEFLTGFISVAKTTL